VGRVDVIHPPQTSDQWRALVDMVNNFEVPSIGREFFD
jgi:hypothetical protein